MLKLCGLVFRPNEVQPSLSFEDHVPWDNKPKEDWLLRVDSELPTGALGRGCLKPSPIHREDLALRTYLDRQSRSEFINFASQIGYDGKNMTLCFTKIKFANLWTRVLVTSADSKC